MVVNDGTTSYWLFYASAEGGTRPSLAACYVAHNDSALAYAPLAPRESFSLHSGWKVRPSLLPRPRRSRRPQLLAEAPEIAPAPAFDPAACLPVSRSPGAAGEAAFPPAPWLRPPLPAPGADPLATPHGRWCGRRHGGFHDCCAGGACTECSAKGGLTPACLAACPPESGLDTACAAHHACSQRHGAEPACAASGSCACAAQLAEGLQQAPCKGKDAGCEAYAGALRTWLGQGAACWEGGRACQKVPCVSDAASGWCTVCGFFKACRAFGRTST